MKEKNNSKPAFIEWLGFRRHPDFTKAQWLGPIFGVIFTILAVALAAAAIVTLFDFLQAALRIGRYANDTDGAAIRNIGLVVAALFGAPFIVWRSIVAAKQARIADEALFNDKINAAAQNLSARREVTRVVVQDGHENVLKEWEDDLVARAAAIDRLEGLVGENNQVAPRISRLLATYVRGNFPCKSLEITEPPFTRKTPRMDLQKAIDTIGRVYKIAVQVDQSHWRLDLKECDLDGVSFLNGYFRAVDFSGSRIEASIFNEGNFEGCLFRRCLLNFSDFRHSNLVGAKFDRIILNRPIPHSGGFTASINLGDFKGATFIAADISAIDYLGEPEEIAATFGTEDTVLSAQMRRKMLKSGDHRSAHLARQLRHKKSLPESDEKKIRELENTGFQHWTPYDSSDLITGHMLEKFLEEMGMKQWPFVG